MNKQSAEIELELAWLINQLPKDVYKKRHSLIRQGYLKSENPKIKDIRIREKDGIYTYTVKSFIKNSKETGYNKEETKTLNKKEFLTLWKKADKKIRKIRYFYSLNDSLNAEIDIYKDNLEGLKVVEVEFSTISSYKSFKIPEWFGKEVTDSKGIYPPFIADLSVGEVNMINGKYVQRPHEFE